MDARRWPICPALSDARSPDSAGKNDDVNKLGYTRPEIFPWTGRPRCIPESLVQRSFAVGLSMRPDRPGGHTSAAVADAAPPLGSRVGNSHPGGFLQWNGERPGMAWTGIPGCTQKAAGGLAPARRTRYGGERTERETPMVEAAFDTIAEVQRLRDVGLKQEQAEAITRSIHAGVTGGVATKADIERHETGLRSDMEKLETGLRSDMEKLETGLRSDMEKLETGLRSDMEKLETGLRSDMEKLETGLRSDMEKLETGLRSEISVIRNDLRWVKLTGGAVLAVLVLPWLAEVAGAALGN